MSVRTAVTTVVRPSIGLVTSTSNIAREKGRAETAPFDLVSLDSRLQGKFNPLSKLSFYQINRTWSVLQDLDIVHLSICAPNSRQLVQLFTLSVFCRMSGKKLITSIETDPDCFKSLISKWLFREIGKMSDQLNVQSKHQQKSIRLSTKNVVIQPSVSITSKTKISVPTKIVPSILAVGSRHNGSSTITVLRAFELVKQKFPRAEITILGNCEALEDSDRIVDKLRCNAVNTVDWAEEDKIRLSDYDLVINMSDSDYLEPIILQSGATGIPLLSTVSESAKELLYSPEINFMFSQTDQNKLADMIIELVEEPAIVATMYNSFKSAPSQLSIIAQ